MDLEDYRAFSAEDFVVDEYFRELVSGKFEPHYSLAQFKQELPEKTAEIDMALNIIKALQGKHQVYAESEKTELWEKIVGVSERSRGRTVKFQIFRYAAAVLLIIGLGAAAMYFSQEKSAIVEVAGNMQISGSDVSLVLADGEQINIGTEESKIQYSGSGTSISVNDTTRLKQDNRTGGFNQIIVPYGKRSSVVLSDGTKVWINSGSKLVYAPIFEGDDREVFLEGEAYFDVATNPNKPFFVRTDEFRIKVLGTKFNVKAYDDDNVYSTVLVEGSISMKINGGFFSREVLLAPNEISTLIKDSDKFQIGKVENAGVYKSWVHGYLEFEKDSLNDVLKRISRYYNIEIEVKTKDKTKIVSGKLDLKAEPERILNGLAWISGTEVTKIGSKYIISE